MAPGQTAKLLMGEAFIPLRCFGIALQWSTTFGEVPPGRLCAQTLDANLKPNLADLLKMSTVIGVTLFSV